MKWIKGQSISWLGHLERMEEDRMPKKIFTQELEGTRRRGRPRKRWKEEVERDFQVLGVRRWRELVADRKKWRDTVRQAKAHNGLQCQWKKKRKIWRYLRHRSICEWAQNVTAEPTWHFIRLQSAGVITCESLTCGFGYIRSKDTWPCPRRASICKSHISGSAIQC